MQRYVQLAALFSLLKSLWMYIYWKLIFFTLIAKSDQELMDIAADRTFLDHFGLNIDCFGTIDMFAIVHNKVHPDIPGTGKEHQWKLDGVKRNQIGTFDENNIGHRTAAKGDGEGMFKCWLKWL
jgi:hypothetical protein